MRRSLPFLIIAAVLIIGSVSALLLYRSKNSSTTPLKIAAGKPGAEPAHVRGPENGKVTLEEFGDFQCPPCGILSKTLQKVEHDYKDSLRVVFREFPLGMHAHAQTAACAAEAAGLQGKFWEMHDLLFEHALNWSKEPPKTFVRVVGPNGQADENASGVRALFSGYAKGLGLDVERFQKDLDTEEVKARIRTDQERAASMGIDRTPVVLIDGVQIAFGSQNERALHDIIDAALKGKPPVPDPTPTPPGQPK
jgi:protein-disulfide isomerase